ncbi:MAG: LacI family transcriptional regulator [candidate division KSB1 bacterium]|nr:LacI family transcriptional regulator [candidate division KSB1 bacterium]MDZ7300564.1 LacI family transcriptional regulator [candidate division KSB1 bacterium]MDZ7309702.1 LacI family transcriptional regulator [candidate division KSB1 bacterium]
MKKVTIEDVARLAGVSKGTVSAVINEKTTVNSETRKAVLNAIKELQYRPRGSARNLKTTTSENSIGLLIRELDNPFYTAIALGVMGYARNKGYLVLIASSEGNHILEENITKSFSIKDIKGAIIAPVLEGTAEIEHLFRLKMINFPFVLLENVKGIQANVVSIDNIKAMNKAVKYLIDNGHSRIVHFAGPKHASHTYERIDGFRRAYSESLFAFNSDMIVPTGAHLEDGYKKCLEYFHNRNREDFPTAIVCYNDLVALGVMAALLEMKIKIPEEISVVGNDDIPFSRHIPVPLTTIRAPMFELGKKAAEILIRNIESPQPLPIENVVLEAEFVVRKSTKTLLSYPKG